MRRRLRLPRSTITKLIHDYKSINNCTHSLMVHIRSYLAIKHGPVSRSYDRRVVDEGAWSFTEAVCGSSERSRLFELNFFGVFASPTPSRVSYRQCRILHRVNHYRACLSLQYRKKSDLLSLLFCVDDVRTKRYFSITVRIGILVLGFIVRSLREKSS